ncbi:AMP-binding protein [Actinomadura meridiana]|uniref:AMP-binding protein n=1 Tax=Actinomadura meridiana TaxID=559626 RepID=A0ABP8BW52_9ACTN
MALLTPDTARMRRAPVLVRDLLALADERGFRLEDAAGRELPATRVRQAALDTAGRLEDIAGSGDGDAVLIRVNDFVASAIAMLGTWMWGGVPVPVPLTAPPPFLAQVTAECRPAARITPAGTDLAVAVGVPAGDPPSALTSMSAAHDIALVLYTSGSTGTPKGILVPPEAVDFSTRSIQRYLGLTEWDRIVSPIVPHFDYGLYQLLLALAADCALTAVPALFVDDVIDVIRDRHGTVLPLVPSIAGPLTARMADLRCTAESVRLITSTGSHLGTPLIARLRDVFPRSQVMPMYGLTECKRVSYLAPPLVDGKPGSVGRPMSGVTCRVVDPDGRTVPDGETGELVVRGPNLALGYLGDERLTDQVFRPVSGGRELWTGDLFTRDADGHLYHRGRRDDLVKVADQRVSLREVEDALRAVPGVIDALAWVDGGTLKASVVAGPPAGDARWVKRELRRGVRLPAMVPADVVVAERLPAGPTGKPARPRPASAYH